MFISSTIFWSMIVIDGTFIEFTFTPTEANALEVFTIIAIIR